MVITHKGRRVTGYPKLSESLYIMSHDSRVLYLAPEYPDWITINARYKGLFHLFDGVHSIDDIVNFIRDNHADEAELLTGQITSLVKTSRLFEHNALAPDLCHKSRDLRLKYVYLTLTDDCNLSCRYCYAKARSAVNTLEAEAWFAIVDRALAVSSPLTFIFTGGEPLLVPYVFDLAAYIYKKGSSCILLTNGTKIDSKKTAEKIASCFELTKVSLDSHRESISSQLRGSGTLERVTTAIDLLAAAQANYMLLSTVTRLNSEDVDEFAKHFGNKVSFQPLYRMGGAKIRSDLFVSGDQYYEVLTKTGLFKYLSDYHRRIHSYRGNPSKRCAMATEELSVAPNGDIYPCHMLHYPELRVGNIESGESLKDLYQNSHVLSSLRELTVDSISQCQECFVRNFCAGGCRARLDFYSEGLSGRDQFCVFEQRLILDALLYSYG